MIERTCAVCNEYVSDVWTVAIRDGKEAQEYSGHFNCISKLQDQINSIKDVHKKTVQQTVNELKL
jgi:hypothetical protein